MRAESPRNEPVQMRSFIQICCIAWTKGQKGIGRDEEKKHHNMTYCSRYRIDTTNPKSRTWDKGLSLVIIKLTNNWKTKI